MGEFLAGAALVCFIAFIASKVVKSKSKSSGTGGGGTDSGTETSERRR